MVYVSQGSKPVVYSESSLNYDRQTAISYKDTPLSTSPKSLPLKNLQFHAVYNDVPNLGISQFPVATASELNVLPFSTCAKLPNQDLLQPGSVVFDEFPSSGHVTVTYDKHGSSCDGSASTPYFDTEICYGTTLFFYFLIFFIFIFYCVFELSFTFFKKEKKREKKKNK